MKTLYTNIDCITNKKPKYHAIIADYDPDIIVTTETNPKNPRFSMTRADLQISGYVLYTNAEAQGSRGVAIHVRESINSMEAFQLDSSEFKEFISVEIKLNANDKLLILAIYRSPNSSSTNNEKLNNLIRNIDIHGYSHLLLLGDFNYPEITWESGGGQT